MAPEQTRGEPADHRADLFSLGVVLYRMSTGEHPFTATDALSTMIAVATKIPATPQVQNFDIPRNCPTSSCNCWRRTRPSGPTQRRRLRICFCKSKRNFALKPSSRLHRARSRVTQGAPRAADRRSNRGKAEGEATDSVVADRRRRRGGGPRLPWSAADHCRLAIPQVIGITSISPSSRPIFARTRWATCRRCW